MKLTICLASILLISIATQESDNYKQAFGSDYTWAINWLKQNNTLIQKNADQFGIQAKELKAIIFPELVRYNTVFDAIEINSLKYLYVSEGKDYADFSVGYFQMKPSFAEIVEQDLAGLKDTVFISRSKLGKMYNLADNEANRKERIARITSIDMQIQYLCAFYKICEQKFADKKFFNTMEKVRIFSTSYNAGYHRTYESLQSFREKKYYHTGKLFSSQRYNYADISGYYFINE
ncbi:MAG: hypothetical protein ABI204_04385 [Ginsengibacter sp.]